MTFFSNKMSRNLPDSDIEESSEEETTEESSEEDIPVTSYFCTRQVLLRVDTRYRQVVATDVLAYVSRVRRITGDIPAASNMFTEGPSNPTPEVETETITIPAEPTNEPDNEPTHGPDEGWLTEEDVLDISFGWHLEDITDDEDWPPEFTNTATDTPTQTATQVVIPERLTSVPQELPDSGQVPIYRQSPPTVANSQIPSRGAVNKTGYHRPTEVNLQSSLERNTRSSVVEDMRGRRGVYPFRQWMTRNGNNRTSRRPYVRGCRQDFRLPLTLPPFQPVEDVVPPISQSQQSQSVNRPAIPVSENEETPRAEGVGDAFFNYSDRNTWPASLIKVVDHYRDRGRNGERFRKRDILHYDNHIRYRLSIKRDGTVRVTLCGYKPPRSH